MFENHKQVTDGGLVFQKCRAMLSWLELTPLSLWPPAKAFARFFPLVSHGAMQARSLPPQEAVEGNHE